MGLEEFQSFPNFCEHLKDLKSLTLKERLLQVFLEEDVMIAKDEMQRNLDWVKEDVNDILLKLKESQEQEKIKELEIMAERLGLEESDMLSLNREKKDIRFSSGFLISQNYMRTPTVDNPNELDCLVPIIIAENVEHFYTEGTVFLSSQSDTVAFSFIVLNPREVHKVFEEHVLSATSKRPIDVYRSKPNSPSVSVTLKRRTEKLHVDLVPVLQIPFSEYKHIDWPRAKTRWPSQELIAKSKETGIDLVAKEVWRPTFSRIENILLEDIDRDGGRRKDALQILLRVLQERWQDFYKTLSSYHLKTVLFWACEKHPEFTKWETLEKSLNVLLDELIRRLESRAVPHYFLSEVNLLRSTEQLSELLLQVTELRRDPVTYLEIQNVFEYSPLDIGKYWYSVMNSQIRLYSRQIKFGGHVFVSSGLFE
ncbi:protein mab-21-like 3 [Acipenser ruthenus]|uniref:protein mab-21-like 3 n=1 Tax=Acipenser ruthenus TaxID=7906 RepID=UPI002740C494|nr:protein mab-21-like 3 [Acipenser ruthenus]